MIIGSSSCDCFGDVVVAPSQMLAIDFGVLGAMLAFPPSMGSGAIRRDYMRLGGVAGFALGAATLMLVTVMQRFQIVETSPGVETRGSTLALDPSRWVGKAFPARNLISGSPHALDHGSCTVWIVDPSCSKCRTTYERESGGSISDAKIIVVINDWLNRGSTELQPEDEPWRRDGENVVELNWPHDVTCPVPVKLHCQDGHVESVEFPARSSMAVAIFAGRDF